MQKPNEKKRRLILATAARLFATRAFHAVRLEDVAAAANVGKGTIYVYFRDKEDLHLTLITEAFATLVARLEEHVRDRGEPATAALRRIVAALVAFALDHPHLAELIRSVGGASDPRWDAPRAELSRIIVATLRRGVRRGEFTDPHPEITALCIPGLVRSVLLFGPRGLDARTVTTHLMRLLEQGIAARPPARPPARSSPRALLAFALALAASGALAGCRDVDDAKEIALFREVLDGDAPQELPPLAAGDPLTLQRALALANRDNESLAQRGEEYLQALVDKKRQAAQFMPTISLAPSYFSREPSDGPVAAFSRNRSLDVPVQAELEDLLPYSQLASIDRAGSNVEARRALLLDAKASLLLDVARAYYAVLRSERQVEVLADSLAVQEERVRDVEAQNQVGFARSLDVEQARAQAASTRVTLVQAGSDARNGRHALAFLVGAPQVDGPLVDRFEVPAEIEPVESIERTALEGRQDLAAARAFVTAALHGVDVAVGQYYPSVSLNLSWFLYKESIPDESLYSALISANLPLFTFGKIHADVRTAWSIFRQAKLSEAQLRRQIANEVQQGFENLSTSAQRLAELQIQVAAAQEAFDQASDLARFGKATNLERLVAQNQLLAAQLDLSSEQYDRKVDYLVLERARGTLTLHVDE